jgi:uncharacterized protein (UPF0332 family)
LLTLLARHIIRCFTPQKLCSPCAVFFSKTHAGVISQFGLQFVNGGLIEEWYAKSLTKAQTKREKADYDIFYDPSNEEAESVLDDAEKFLARIQVAIRELNKP